MVMKNKLFITTLFLLIGSKSFAQIDTLNVYLESSLEHRYGVNLVFENNSNDTIFLFTRFHNLSLGGLMPRYSGINIQFFSDDRRFTFNWGEHPERMFIFSNGRTLIYPHSRVKLFFDIGSFVRFPETSTHRYEISFFMNFSFAKHLRPETSVDIVYFETNRVTIIEPSEEEYEDDRSDGYEK